MNARQEEQLLEMNARMDKMWCALLDWRKENEGEFTSCFGGVMINTIITCRERVDALEAGQDAFACLFHVGTELNYVQDALERFNKMKKD